MKKLFVLLLTLSTSVIVLVGCRNINESSADFKNTVESSSEKTDESTEESSFESTVDSSDESVTESSDESAVVSNVKYIIQNPEGVEYVQVPVTEENSKEMEKLVNAFIDSSVPNEAYSFSKSLPDDEAPMLGMPLMLERYEDGAETMKIALFLYDYCVDEQDFQSGEYVVFYPDEDMVKGFDCPKEEYSALCMAIKNEIG